MEGSQMAVHVKDESDDALIELPPGFRFHPTDEEIVTHYLTPKVLDHSFTSIAIGEADLNRSEPWELPKKAKMGEEEWYFFCQRDRKYPTGMRTNRATESGYWKATGKDKEIFKATRELLGMKKTLVFYKGRAPRGEKTNWVMHEFRLEGKLSYYTMATTSTKDEWVVCRVFHKSTGAQKSPVSNHGLNAFVEDLLDSPPQLPQLMDHSTLILDSNFTIGHPYFPRDQPEILHNEDYKNTLESSYSYNFDTNTYQDRHQYNDLAPKSTIYLSNTSLKIEKKKNASEKHEVEHLIPTFNQSRNISASYDVKASNAMTNGEKSSPSMLLEHDSRMMDYDQDDEDVGRPSTFSELDSLLQY